MAKLDLNGLDIEVESAGKESDPAVLLIMGLGMQLTAWPDAFVQNLLLQNLRVIRFDNRDCGLSSKFDAAGRPNLMMMSLRHFLHLPLSTAYGLEDMAQDAVGILDALHIERAHVVGVSMGGMIAQLIAADHSDRVLTLTSIMSTSGAAELPAARAEVMRALLARPRNSEDLESVVDHFMNLLELIGSPGFPTPKELARERLMRSLQRNYCPSGTARQMVAIAASGDRSAKLARIRVPTLVIHGTDDALVPVEAGRDTARKITGSKLFLIPGMGHDLAPGLVPIITDALRDHLTPSSR
ncbi:MAG: alpha/beta hydrolase [Burkholderiaceae bacterium]|jgi:proline iminopeptidase